MGTSRHYIDEPKDYPICRDILIPAISSYCGEVFPTPTLVLNAFCHGPSLLVPDSCTPGYLCILVSDHCAPADDAAVDYVVLSAPLLIVYAPLISAPLLIYQQNPLEY